MIGEPVHVTCPVCRSQTAQEFSGQDWWLPAGWRTLPDRDGFVVQLCSWRCVSIWSARRADEDHEPFRLPG